MDTTDYELWKRYRIPRRALRQLAVRLRVPFDSLYRSLNGNINVTTDVADALERYTKKGITAEQAQNTDIDMLNRYIYTVHYQPPEDTASVDDLL